MSTTRIPPASITGPYGALVTRMTRRMFGDTPEPLGVLWHNRRVLHTGLAQGRRTQKWDACDSGLKSYAHLAVMSLVGCSWCLDFGYFEAHHKGLDVNKAREVPGWRESEAFTPLERDVMEYAEAMSFTPPTVTDELSARLLAELGAPALVELTSYVAMANQAARTNIALGIESQGFSASCGLRPMAQRPTPEHPAGESPAARAPAAGAPAGGAPAAERTARRGERPTSS